MKVFVTRMIPQDGLRLLKEMFEVEIFKHDRPITKKELLEQARGSDGLLCLLTDKIDEEIIETLGIKAIANYAVGVDNIDVKAATERNIPVTNTPGVLTEATADLTFALLLAVSRRIVEADKYVRDGNFKGWEPM
ncbi:MAG: D-glycerate dehydrogenase, partial [Candidatus Heimdallarchaeota archaeon]|nr:D-glycerate dehydrogenase [Candidatus Heimdallarchaeota archaeon]